MTKPKRTPDELSGYVYVVAFSHGTVKVGQTRAGQRRDGGSV